MIRKLTGSREVSGCDVSNSGTPLAKTAGGARCSILLNAEAGAAQVLVRRQRLTGDDAVVDYAKLAALADYGFSAMRLSDDWEGADLIAQHVCSQNGGYG